MTHIIITPLIFLNPELLLDNKLSVKRAVKYKLNAILFSK